MTFGENGDAIHVSVDDKIRTRYKRRAPNCQIGFGVFEFHKSPLS